MIVNLDDDCMPDDNENFGAQREDEKHLFLMSHWGALNFPGARIPAFDTMESLSPDAAPPWRPRGYPKEPPACRTVLNHGLWNGVPDIDGETN